MTTTLGILHTHNTELTLFYQERPYLEFLLENQPP